MTGTEGRVKHTIKRNDTYRNAEKYHDPTAGKAIQKASQQPELISWYIKTIKDLAEIMDLEIVGYVAVKDKKKKIIL